MCGTAARTLSTADITAIVITVADIAGVVAVGHVVGQPGGLCQLLYCASGRRSSSPELEAYSPGRYLSMSIKYIR